MRRIITFIINTHHSIFRYFSILITIIIITFLFPSRTFNYDFTLGKPWKYENLVAPFSFNIQKNEDSIWAEKNRVLQQFYPYYTFDDKAKELSFQQFNTEFPNYYTVVKDTSKLHFRKIDSIYYRNLGIKTLDNIYKKGVISIAEQHQNQVPTLTTINLSTDKNTVIKHIDAFYNLNSACYYAKDTLQTIPNTITHFVQLLVCKSIKPNIVYNDEKSNKIRNEVLSKISETNGRMQQGEIIIAQNALVTTERYQKLKSLQLEYGLSYKSDTESSKYRNWYIYLGRFLIVSLILTIFIIFMYEYENQWFLNLKSLTFIFFILISFLYLVRFAVEYNRSDNSNMSLYMLPFCIIPILIKNFFSSRMAHNLHIVVILIAGFMIPLGYEYLFLHFITGLVAIVSNRRAYYWSQFFKSTAFIFITYCISYLAILLIQQGSTKELNLQVFGWLTINALLTMLVYPFIPVFERIFGFLSNITLIELGDLNQPLLKELSRKAAGTFHHSLQVASLAETAALEVKANAMLAKVGALYHDIGKMNNPLYFIENQKTEINPHDDLSPEESARIIINHVADGVTMASQQRLPLEIVNFIRTHHGNGLLEAFFLKYKELHPERDADDRLFRYRGRLPNSKETAIVMLADSIEASSRSLSTYSENSISNLVDKIIDNKIKQNQLINCNLTFKDITQLRKVFKKHLRSIYHVRISYPEGSF